MRRPYHEHLESPVASIIAGLVFGVSLIVLHIAYSGPGTFTPANGWGLIRSTSNKMGFGFAAGDVAPGSTLAVKGNLSIGSAYVGSIVPRNGMAIQENLGVGMADPQGRLEITGGGIVINGTPQMIQPHERVPQGNSLSDMTNAYQAFNSPITIVIGRDGLPLVAYVDGTGLRLIRCADLTCPPPPTSSIATIAAVTDARFAAMAIGSDGNPIIAFQADSTLGINTLHFTKCNDPKCLTSNTFKIESDLDPNIYIAITVGVDGFPVIAYLGLNSTGGNTLSVIKCGNLSCTSIPSGIQDVVVSGALCGDSFGSHNSIAIGIDGYPAIVSFCRNAPRHLYFVHCTSLDCSTYNNPVKLDGSTGDIGKYASLAIGSDGLPVVAYYDDDTQNGALKIGKCLTITCGTDIAPAFNSVFVDDSPGSQDGLFASIAIGADGLPIVAYRVTDPQGPGPEDDIGYVRFIKCGTHSCASPLDTNDSSRSIFNLDGVPPSGSYPSITIGPDGLPITAYVRFTGTNRIRVIRCGSENCVPFWTNR